MNTLVSESQPVAPASSPGRVFAAVGSVCLFAPLFGVSITVASMIRSFDEMPHSAPTTDPATLSRSVGDALVATAIGFGVSVLGICLVCIAIFAFRFTPRWLWNALMAGSILWLFAFPIGTVIAVIAIIILVRQRHVFAAPRIA